jgi:hypothetical protein
MIQKQKNRETARALANLKGEVVKGLRKRCASHTISKAAVNILEESTLNSIYDILHRKHFEKNRKPRPENPGKTGKSQLGYRIAMAEYLESCGMKIHTDDAKIMASTLYEALADYIQGK